MPRLFPLFPLLCLSCAHLQAATWQEEQFGAQANNPAVAGWEADPDGDGVVNLLERAFNMPPLQAGTPSSGTAPGTTGLPWVSSVIKPEGPVLTIHYLRLKDSAASGLSYTPEFSSSPEEDENWIAATGPETVESINGDWERVTIGDVIALPTASRFARLRVHVSDLTTPGLWLDSVAGNDSNDGLGKAGPVRSVARLAALAGDMSGKTVWVAKGSVFLDQLTLRGNNLTVSAYGDGPPPLFDCREIIPSFTKTAGRAHVYEAPVALPGKDIIKGNGWADESMLVQVASLELCDATPGSCYVSNWAAASATFYVHAPGSAVPAADGRTYRYSKREHGLLVIGNNVSIKGIRTRGNAHPDGSLKVSGSNAVLTGVRCEDGGSHAAYTKGGSTFTDCYFYRGRSDTQGARTANSLVVNQPTLAGQAYSTLRCTFDGGDTPYYTGPAQHGATLTQLFDNVTHTDPRFINCYGWLTHLSRTTNVIRPVFTNCDGGLSSGSAGGTLTIAGGTGTINQLTNAAAGGEIICSANTLTVPMAKPGFYRCDSTATDLSLRINGDRITVLDGAPFNNQLIRHMRGSVQAGSMRVLPVLCNPLDDILVAGFSGGTSDYQGAGNIWPYGARFTLNGKVYSTLAEWQAAGYDATSATAEFPAPATADNFDRNDENLEASSGWILGGGTSGQAAVRAGRLAATGTQTAYYRRSEMGSPDHWVRFTVGSVPRSAGPYIVLRAIDQDNWIGVRWTSTAWHITTCIQGALSFSVAGSSALAPAAGQKVVLAMRGDKAWLYVNDRCLINRAPMGAPSLASAGGVGILCRDAAVDPLIDDFACGLVR